MANKKKNNRRPTYTRPSSRTPGTPVTVRDKKKQLIRERIHKYEDKSIGMRAMGIIAAAIMLSRAGLFVYEMAFYAAIGERLGVVSNLLLLPLLIIIYMAHDGNRGLLGITAASAIVRVFYMFLSMYPVIEGTRGAVAFASVYLAVMAAQFIMSVVALSMPKTAAYCEEMRKINMELRVNLMNRR